jgi:hypothetical protein
VIPRDSVRVRVGVIEPVRLVDTVCVAVGDWEGDTLAVLDADCELDGLWDGDCEEDWEAD